MTHSKDVQDMGELIKFSAEFISFLCHLKIIINAITQIVHQSSNLSECNLHEVFKFHWISSALFICQ